MICCGLYFVHCTELSVSLFNQELLSFRRGKISFLTNAVITGTHLTPVDDHSLIDDLAAFVLSTYSESEKTKKV